MKARLSDAAALAKFSKVTRDLIKRKGFVRCLDRPKAWHPEHPTTPGTDFHDGKGPCDCRVRS